MHAQFNAAVDTLAAIAKISSLQYGQVVFDADSLAGGQWYPASECGFSLDELPVPVPEPAAEGEALRAVCALALRHAIERRTLEAQQVAAALGETRLAA